MKVLILALYIAGSLCFLVGSALALWSEIVR